MRALLVNPAYLGDTVFLGPAVRALKARWPEGSVALCVTPRGAPAARLLPGCDEVFVYDKRRADRGFLGLCRVGAALRAFRPDLALVPHSSARSGALAFFSGAPRRIGYPLLCNERVRLDRSRPFVDRSLLLAERAGAPGSPELTLERPTDVEEAYAERALSGAKPPVVGLVPGAEWATKRWAPDNWAALAAALSRHGATVVLLGGPADFKAASRIRALARVPVRDTTGNSVEEAIAVLARCDLVIGGDTGLVHCARALGRKVVIVFGPTDPARHRFTMGERHVELRLACQPCHDHGPKRCPLGHHDCMRLLGAETIVQAAGALLGAPLAY
ncbi:MAG TPA: glycosyltransferase family 9 protein [Anaeromyxobacteraceae bacterium]|nr:glycosyltransferase family 9 protein [Anaeromyxobacteraceae bacterium]